MRMWNGYKTGLALIAAMCFAVLAGLHAARPVSTDVALSVYGYTAGEICGFGEGIETRDCPNCTLATAAVASGDIDLQAWQAVSTVPLVPIWGDAPYCGGAVDPYQARGPPEFT